MLGLLNHSKKVIMKFIASLNPFFVAEIHQKQQPRRYTEIDWCQKRNLSFDMCLDFQCSAD